MSNFPTLDGLNNIDADSGNLTNITCETFIATASAQVPTVLPGSSDNNAASTQFVTDAITNAPYVTIDTTQTLTTGTKFFTNLPECSTLATTGNQFTNKTFVDNAVSGAGGAFVTLSGNQTLGTGVKTFTNLPQSTAVPSANADLTNKSYVDNNFVGLTGTQTITGNKTFTGNCVFNVASGTTTIRGNQVDIFPTVTFLTSLTTTISGTNANFVSTTNFIGGTNCNITSPATTLSGTTTTLSSPTINVTGTALNISSPTTTISGANTNFTGTNTTFSGTNTNLTGTIATATTQASSDNSTKVATTAFVNNYSTANYMTLTTNQNVSGVKTYSTKQIFNAGTACNTYDATGVTDMTLANNNGDKGILTIADGRIITDAYGVRIAETRNLQLNAGTFIQPNPAVGVNDYTKPDFAFSTNRTQGYADIVGVPNSAQATRQINILQGIFSWFAGYNQTTTFTISHSIDTTSTAIASMNEAEVVFYFQDFNTGIVRYTTPNLATTTGFALPANSSVVRPSITFTLTTEQLPEGDYLFMAYSRVTNAYAVNAGVLSVNFGLPASPNTEATVQNYNTPIDYTFTSRNVYHCFRNTAMCGVYIINNIATQQNIMTPIHYSISDFTNFTFQPSVSGALTTPAVTGGTVAGNFVALSINNADNIYLVYPNYSLILYDTAGWSGTIYINFKNTTSNPVTVAPTTTQRGSSCRIYFDEVELIKY